jgi:primosomal protein N' (replication factor Y)
VTQVKPLRLKAQRAPKKVTVASENPVVQVCVDTGVFHLPDTYDYLVPEALSDQVRPGVFVKIPFGSEEVMGYVQSREPSLLDSKSLKNLSKVISPIPLLTEELIEIVNLTCERYACKPWDVIRSAIPARAASVESEFLGQVIPQLSAIKPKLEHQVSVTKSFEDLPRMINQILGKIQINFDIDCLDVEVKENEPDCFGSFD